MNSEKELEPAEQETDAATEKRGHGHPFKVDVSYNGVTKDFEVRPEELVKALLDNAIKKFGPIPNPHTLSLFSAAGDELNDAETLEVAGVKPLDMLLLRPSKVKGGE